MKVRYRKTYYAVSLVISDVFMSLAALRFSFWLKFESDLMSSPHGMPQLQAYTRAFGLVVVILIAVYRAYGLYVEERIKSFWEEAILVMRATTFTFVLLLAVTFFYRDFSFSRGYLLVAWLMVPVFVFLWRVVLGYAYMFYRRSTNKFKETLMIGANHDSIRFALRKARQPRECVRVMGILDDRYPYPRRYKRIPVYGKVKDLERILNENENINEVILTSAGLPRKKIVDLMMICEKHLVSFRWASDILGLMATRMSVVYDSGIALVSCRESPLLDWENRLIKRAGDIALSALGLVALSPVFAVLGIMIKLDSPGPVYYHQERIGEDGKKFKIIKFRTMRPGAEAGTGPVWAKKHDPRRTRSGGFLRKTNLDELPQLWNVLKGDMSMVGPRPERPHFVGRFKEGIPRYMGRHLIKSGLTGWAQVNGLRGDTSIEERTKYDLYYIENWSVKLDLKILLRTVFAFKNAY